MAVRRVGAIRRGGGEHLLRIRSSGGRFGEEWAREASEHRVCRTGDGTSSTNRGLGPFRRENGDESESVCMANGVVP